MLEELKYYIQRILCYNNIHWYKDADTAYLKSRHIRYVCDWCGKTKK